MAVIPQWMMGRHVTSLILTTQTIAAATGGLADAVAENLITSTGTLHQDTFVHTLQLVAEVEATSRKGTEDIGPLTSSVANHVRVTENVNLTITENLQQGAVASNNVLARIYHTGASRVVKAVFARSGNTFTAYLLMTRYRERHSQNVLQGIGTFAPVAIHGTGAAPNSAAPTYV